MNKLQLYTKTLKVRNSIKQIQQISWIVSQIEKRYNIETMQEEDLEILLDAYLDFIPDIERILNELKYELNK